MKKYSKKAMFLALPPVSTLVVTKPVEITIQVSLTQTTFDSPSRKELLAKERINGLSEQDQKQFDQHQAENEKIAAIMKESLK